MLTSYMFNVYRFCITLCAAKENVVDTESYAQLKQFKQLQLVYVQHTTHEFSNLFKYNDKLYKYDDKLYACNAQLRWTGNAECIKRSRDGSY